MNKYLTLCLFCFLYLTGNLQSQSINLSFTGHDSITMQDVILDSVMIHNITSNCDTIIYGPTPSINLDYLTRLKDQPHSSNKPFEVRTPYPNPATGKTKFNLIIKEDEYIDICLFDIRGTLLYKQHFNLEAGEHHFIMEPSDIKILFISVSNASHYKALKVINMNSSPEILNISHIGFTPLKLKHSINSEVFIFNPGDQLSFTCKQNGYHQEVIYDFPYQDSCYLFIFNPALTVNSIGISHLTPTSTIAHGEVISGGGEEVTLRGFCWSNHTNPSLQDNFSMNGSGTGLFESILDDLLPDSTYYCKAYAINSMDTSYGEVIEFSTPGDGWYIKGTAIAYNEFNDNALMSITRNEITQLIDTNILELYIPVLAMDDGFNIVEVNGTNVIYYGPDEDFSWIYNGLPGEPEVPFQRGSFIEDTIPFTVQSNAMYHIAIYINTQKVSVAPVYWGMIGSATNNGWNYSVDMDESEFDLYEMTWSLDSISLSNGEWKFRYSNGWKVYLDNDMDIAVNSNFGGTIDSLVPGGDNIINNEPGIYECCLNYQLGNGYHASLNYIHTDTIPTIWDGVICDAVGTGISFDNPNAIPDPSGWAWGYRIIADNGGIPTYFDGIYTWVWSNVILEAHEGFKLRTLNGLPSPINDMNFDAGYLDLNVDESTPVIYDGGPPSHNLMTTMKTSYTITLNIDATNNDDREIIILMD